MTSRHSCWAEIGCESGYKRLISGMRYNMQEIEDKFTSFEKALGRKPIAFLPFTHQVIPATHYVLTHANTMLT